MAEIKTFNFLQETTQGISAWSIQLLANPSLRKNDN